MKIYKIFLVLLNLFFVVGISFGYQQQGFSQYQESSGGVSFLCKNECTIKLGSKNEMDYLYLSGVVNGSGVVGYGYYAGDRFNFLDELHFKPNFQINKFSDLMRYNWWLNLKSSDLLLFMSGDVQGNLYVQTGNLSFGQKVDLVRDFFWYDESFYQDSLMYRSGVRVRGISIVKLGYFIFILVSLYILLSKKGKRKFKLIFYVGLGLFLFIGIRNMVTYTDYLKQGLIWFEKDKSYFDLGDYFSFIDKIRTKLDLDSNEYREDNCKILLEYGSDFYQGLLDIYLEPCQLASTGDYVDYKVYYKKEIPIYDYDKKVLLDFSGSYLLENKSK